MVVFLWWCLCVCDLRFYGGVVVSLCFCGDVFVFVFLCFWGGVVVLLCFCGGVFVLVVVLFL